MYAARVNEDPAVKRLWIAQIVSPAISGPLVEALGANSCFLLSVLRLVIPFVTIAVAGFPWLSQPRAV